jgi:hypothetical protein
MAKPNSKTTWVRNFLVGMLTPYPKFGFAWCIDCVYNDGKTWEMFESVIKRHVEAHSRGGTANVVMTRQPREKIEEAPE